MSTKYHKIIPRALVVLGILIGVFLINPACYAGGAMTIIPAEDRDVPEGSQISEERSKAIEKKVTEYKVQMQKVKAEQQQEQKSQKESPRTPVPEKRY